MTLRTLVHFQYTQYRIETIDHWILSYMDRGGQRYTQIAFIHRKELKCLFSLETWWWFLEKGKLLLLSIRLVLESPQNTFFLMCQSRGCRILPYTELRHLSIFRSIHLTFHQRAKLSSVPFFAWKLENFTFDNQPILLPKIWGLPWSSCANILN